MALYLSTNRQEFCGEFEYEKERVRIPLGVPVRGVCPPTLRMAGDAAFERSRGKAMEVFAVKKAEFLDPQKAASRLRRIHELQAGIEFEKAHPEALVTFWLRANRKKSKMSASHVQNGTAAFVRFSKFMADKNPRVGDLRGVTAAMAEDFMKIEEERGIAPKTVDNILGFLHAAFEAARSKCGLAFNPFGEIKKKNGRSTHRKPYSDAELERILGAANTNGLVGWIVIVAICTGMRRENCIRLRWCDVNLEANELRLFALKTGDPLFIPILLPLRQLLEGITKQGEYCFPGAVAEFEKKHDVFDAPLKRLLKSLGFDMRHEPQGPGQRLRRPSVHGFARFKTTFVTQSLNAGIPMEMLQKVVGNSVVEVVKKNYYRPTTESIKEQFSSKLPAFLTGVAKAKPLDHVDAAIVKLGTVTEKNWTETIGEVRDLLNQARLLLTANK